jgi:ATP-dependent Lhr-like helicase
VIVSAADPLNLTGIITPGERVASLAPNRVGYRDGVPTYALEGGKVRALDARSDPANPDVRRAMVRSRPMPALRGYVGRRV